MNKNKRKIANADNIISDELAKKIKTSYSEVDDSNALVLPSKKKAIPKEKRIVKDSPKLLSKKQRKELEKKLRVKEQKSSIKDLYAELEAFNNLKPEKAVESLKEDVKKQIQLPRNKLSEKVKMVRTKKLKSWQKAKNKNHAEDEVRDSSPNTSDFSSDDDDYVDDKNNNCDNGIENNVLSDESRNQCKSLAEKSEPEVHKKIEQLDTTEKSNKIEMVSISKPRPVSFVLVNRLESVQEARLELPILGEEATIMEEINNHDVIILSGATGCGKTTQVPQFLYEAGYTKNGMKIGITEPRRVAAMSMSKRVAYELCCENKNLVSYHIRYDKNATCSTQIKFMTDGVLLQEIKRDTLLKTYSAIIIDEAHERSVYSDMLIGLLSIIVRARRRDYEKVAKDNDTPDNILPLKLIIMSATLRVSDFAENKRLFPGLNRPPIIELPTRQHPVTVKFNKHTRKQHLEEAFKKVVEVHEKYPEGGILVFVTGQQEVLTLCKWLRNAFPVSDQFLNQAKNTQDGYKGKVPRNANTNDELIKVNLTDFSIIPIDEESEMNVADDFNEVSNEDDDLEDPENDTRDDIQRIIGGAYSNINLMAPIHALPLYSLLPAEKQSLVFQSPPANQRFVVVATNVAETSLTIPNVKYVIDTGMEKVKKWDPITGISKFELARINQSSAEQRAGRAGRMGPGLCFRLYSSNVFQEMKKFSDPEIMQRPIEDVVLMLRNYIHSSIPIHKFCLPTIPSELAIAKAEKILLSLGALKLVKQSKSLSGTVTMLTEMTDLGKCMCQIPLNPRFSRMLLLANQHGLLSYAVMMVSVLSVSNFFVSDQSQGESNDTNLAWEFKRKFVQKRPDLAFGDVSVLLGSVCQMEKVYMELGDEHKTREVAETHGVRWQAFLEIRKLRKQLTDILNLNIKHLDLQIDPYLPRPTNSQFQHLRQLVLSGSPTNVARLAPLNLTSHKDQKQRRREKGMYQCSSIAEPVYIHTNSVLHREKFEWVVFQDLYKSSTDGAKEPKAYMRNVMVIEPQWLPIFCTLECKPEGLILNHLLDKDADQLPYYDENHDCILACAKKIFYGERSLQLPQGTRIPLVPGILEDETVQGEKIRRWFAKFFVEGRIFKQMNAWRSKFKSLCKPDLILNPIGSQRSEIKSILKSITDLETPSKKAICDQWKLDKNYLLNSYLEWILPDEHEFIKSNWPPAE